MTNQTENNTPQETDHSRFADIFGDQNEDNYQANLDKKRAKGIAESNEEERNGTREEKYEEVEIFEPETGTTYIELRRIETTDRTETPERIMEALRTYNACKGNAMFHLSDADAKDHHFGMLQGLVDLEEEQKLLSEGTEYHAQGYRLKSSTHQIRGGASFTVPSNALASEIVSAGYIGTAEKSRLEYLVKINISK